VLEAAVSYPGARREALRALVKLNLDRADLAAARRWIDEAGNDDAELLADARVRELIGK
jgi:hypothetical protein